MSGQRGRGTTTERHTPEHSHGTLTGYTYWLCRCQPCRAAALTYQRNYRTRKRLGWRA